MKYIVTILTTVAAVVVAQQRTAVANFQASCIEDHQCSYSFNFDVANTASGHCETFIESTDHALPNIAKLTCSNSDTTIRVTRSGADSDATLTLVYSQEGRLLVYETLLAVSTKKIDNTAFQYVDASNITMPLIMTS